MKILLISPPNCFDESHPIPSLTLATLSGILTRENIEHLCIDGNQSPAFLKYKQKQLSSQGILEEIIFKVNAYNPDLVCISLWGVSIPFTLQISSAIKNSSPQLTIICGGINDLDTANYILKNSSHIDYVFVGEAEIGFPGFLNAFLHKEQNIQIPGVFSKSMHNADAYADTPKKLLLSPNYDHFEKADTSALFMETSRGCVHQCIFCGLHSTPFRRMSPADSIAQINQLIDKYNTNYINFADNFLPMRGQWIEHFLELLINNKNKFNWSCLIRADNMDKKILKNLRKAGCIGVFMGIESTNADTLRYMKKCRQPDVYIKQLVDNITAIKEYGINIKVSTIIGFPNETKENMLHTAQFVLQLLEKGVQAYSGPLVIYPNSELWEKYKRGDIVLNQIVNKKIRRNSPGLFYEQYPADPIIVPNDYIPQNKHMSSLELEEIIGHILSQIH